jgi:hypothetical protein
MQTSIFLARLIGTPLLIIGAAVLLNQAWYRTMIREVIASKISFYVAAALGLIVGLAIVLAHNVWTLNWRVLITLFGWVNLLRGVVTVLFPAQAMEFAGRHIGGSKHVPLIPGAVAVILGLILCFFGYFR